MDDVERDSSITINIGFGNLTYDKDETGSFVRAILDLSIDNPSGTFDHVEVSARIASAPHTDTILDLVERTRAQISSALRSASAHLDRDSAADLLYAPSALEVTAP